MFLLLPNYAENIRCIKAESISGVERASLCHLSYPFGHRKKTIRVSSASGMLFEIKAFVGPPVNYISLDTGKHCERLGDYFYPLAESLAEPSKRHASGATHPCTSTPHSCTLSYFVSPAVHLGINGQYWCRERNRFFKSRLSSTRSVNHYEREGGIHLIGTCRPRSHIDPFPPYIVSFFYVSMSLLPAWVSIYHTSSRHSVDCTRLAGSAKRLCGS